MRIGIAAEVEAKADHRLEIVFHQPRPINGPCVSASRPESLSQARPSIHAWL
jgi:hypothetical protein